MVVRVGMIIVVVTEAVIIAGVVAEDMIIAENHSLSMLLVLQVKLMSQL